MATLAPRSASARAMARPIRLAAPVTSTVFPLSSLSIKKSNKNENKVLTTALAGCLNRLEAAGKLSVGLTAQGQELMAWPPVWWAGWALEHRAFLWRLCPGCPDRTRVAPGGESSR